MATRPILPRLSVSLSRSVVHHARPPRLPAFRNPHEAPASRPTEGTSTSHPANLGGAEPSTSSSSLEGTSLTFHHSPPPTAPSYTTGVVPDLLRWTAGEEVRLTGEEAAPLRKTKKFAPYTPWTDDMKRKIIELRAMGRTRSQIGKDLNIPREEQYRIPHVAPLSKAQAAQLAEEQRLERESWGERKSLARAIRERRKTFW